MELTKKQRRDIYLNVADNYHNHIGWGLCTEVANESKIHWGYSLKTFPELALFQPDQNEGAHNRWWQQYEYEPRIICMLLCAEMCK